MVADGWRTGTGLIEHLRSRYYRFDLFQMVRLLRIYAGNIRQSIDDMEPVDDDISFISDTGFDFSATEVAGLHLPDRPGEPVRVKVSSFILSGRDGPIPESHRELLFRRIQNGDMILNDFLDIFNDRLNKLRCGFREMSCTGLTVRHLSRSRLAWEIRHVTGFSATQKNREHTLQERMLMAFSGLLAGNRRGAVVVTNILATIIGAPVKIEQFTGKWCDIEPDDHTHLGAAGKNSRLGKNTVLGTRVWNMHGSVTLHIGPVGLSAIGDIVPGGRKHAVFIAVVRFLLKGECDCEVSAVVRCDDIPESRLYSGNAERPDHDRTRGLILSRNAWISTIAWKPGNDPIVRFVMKTGG